MAMPSVRFHDTVKSMPGLDAETRQAMRQALAGWYLRSRRDLPWRHGCDPYRIWVSEVMLQQTQVQTVMPYYHRFMAQFPDVFSLARADLQSVLKRWEGLGYYSRARNLHKAAGMVASEMNGQMPNSREALRRLPGVGEYIAAAVLSIAFNQAHAVVDGNVKRVLARLFLLDAPVNRALSHKIFGAWARELLDVCNPGDHNQAMMELGALICTPRRPGCHLCPVARFCMALQRGLVQRYPHKDQRRSLPTRRMVAAAVFKNGKVLVVQRPEQGLLGGLWEFPAGLLEAGADPAGICLQQLKSTANLDARVDNHIAAISHVYTHFKLQMDLYLCCWQSGRVRLNGYAHFQWLSPARIGDLPLHGAMHKALAFVESLPLPVNGSNLFCRGRNSP
jgi:A/G-specific adenine glycosylase